MQRSLSPKLGLPNLDVKRLTVGFSENISKQIIVYHILLLFKRYIYLRKLENKSVHFVGFKFFTKTIMKVEEKYLREKVRSLCTIKNAVRERYYYIMTASNETIVICNVKPYGREVGYGERGWEKVLSFKK